MRARIKIKKKQGGDVLQFSPLHTAKVLQLSSVKVLPFTSLHVVDWA